MRLEIFRHADPAYPEDRLSSLGHAQARQVAEWLGRVGCERLISSPMTRAIETAEHCSGSTGLPIEIEPWLAELEDWWIEQEPYGEAPAWEVRPDRVRGRLDSDPWQVDGLRRFAPRYERFREQADDQLERLGGRREGPVYRLAPSAPQRVAVICHAGVALTWLAHLLETPPPLVWAGFELAPATAIRIELREVREGRSVPRCSAVGFIPPSDVGAPLEGKR